MEQCYHDNNNSLTQDDTADKVYTKVIVSAYVVVHERYSHKQQTRNKINTCHIRSKVRLTPDKDVHAENDVRIQREGK